MTERLAIEGGHRLCETRFPEDYPTIDKEDLVGVVATLRSRKLTIFTSGEVAKFEERYRSYIGSRYCTLTSNCTSAIGSSLIARETHKHEGAEVILPAYTYAATAMAAVSLGFRPVFADVELDTYNISPRAVESLITKKTTAVVGVHLFGNPFDLARLKKIEAENENLSLIEDCAQATGATYRGKCVGSFGTGCHSFGENKLMRIGEGGAVTTDDPEIDRRVKLVRDEGETWTRTGESGASATDISYFDFVHGFDYTVQGFNFRPMALQASLGLSQLRKLNRDLRRRRENAKYLQARLRKHRSIVLPKVQVGSESAWYTFAIRVNSGDFDRDTFLMALMLEGIPAGVHYPKPLPQCSVFERYGKPRFPNTQILCEQQVALPVYPGLTRKHLDMIVECTTKVLARLEEAPEVLRRLSRGRAETLRIRNVIGGLYMVV